MGKLKIVGIGISVFAGLFLIMMAVAVSNIDSSPSIENLQSKITILESENDKLKNGNTNQKLESEISKLKAQNSQLQFKIDNIQKKDEMTCNEMYDTVIQVGLSQSVLHEIVLGLVGSVIIQPDILKNDDFMTNAKMISPELTRLINEYDDILDELSNNPKLDTCNFSPEKTSMILFLESYLTE